MGSYVLKRLAQLVPVVFVITAIVFVLVRLTGDPIGLMLGEEATPEQIERVTRARGLDRPILVQYAYFLRDITAGTMGVSIVFDQEALPLVLERFPATLRLMVASLAIAIIIAVPAGVLAATRRNSWFDFGATTFAILGQAMPNYWLGIMLILLFSVILGWLPVSGIGSPLHLVLPAVTLGTAYAAVLMRLMRSNLLEVLNQDFVTTARSKGLSGRVVVFKHALRNALIPFVTVLGLQVTYLLSGSIIVEQVFAWPGMGRLVIVAVNARDMAVVQAVVLVMATLVMVTNLMVDFIYALIDPRIAYS